jgi:hypothetical protein
MKNILSAIYLITITVTLNGQVDYESIPYNDDCNARFNYATNAFNDSHFFHSKEILVTIIKSCKLSKPEMEAAYEMLVKSYLETNELEKADSVLSVMLKKYPHHNLNESVNQEQYNRLINKFNIHPLFTIGAKNTANWMRRPTMKVYSVLDGLDYSQPLIEEGYWFTYYGMAEYEFTDGISINADFMTFWARYGRDFYKPPGFNLSYWERDCFVEFPVYIKKYFHIGKNILVYGSGGLGVLYMTSARGNATISYTAADAITGKNADFSDAMYDVDMKDMRNRITGHWNTGIGIGYRLRNLRMFIDTRYLGGIGSFTAPEKSDLMPALKNDFFYIDNEMKINQFEVGATISYTLFNSVKRIRK